MTEAKLRQKVADIINGWIGAQRGDATHKRILSIYNNHKPLARSYPVQISDAYCATGASAAYIEAGISDYTGTECGVERWVDIAKAKGIWQENDAYRPGVGDAICYDWDDSGVGDNHGYSDHVGIVVAVSGDAITVTECNINGGKVGQRVLMVNGRYIRGFICPDFRAIAAALSGGTSAAPVKTVTEIVDEADADTPIKDDVDTPPETEESCTVELPILRIGARGEFVETLQLLLRHYFNPALGLDGYFGPVTETNVKEYQRKHGEEVDGIVGPITWRLLLR